MQKATIKDVARKAGVSISTVHNAISGKRFVSPELSEQINQAIAEFDYKPNMIASRLRSGRSNMIGVIVTTFKNTFIGQLLNAIQEAALIANYTVCVYESNSNLQAEIKCLGLLCDTMVDGLIILSQANDESEVDKEYIKRLSDLTYSGRKIPVVSLDKKFGKTGINSVVSDNRKAGYDAVRHLLNLGHRKIGLIKGPMDTEMCRFRFDGYKDALRDAGVKFTPTLVRNGDFTPLMGYACTRDLLERRPDTTAVFAMNDQSAIGAMKAIQETGRSIPGDVAVMGFDNIYPGTLVTPSLSTISIPKYQMGALAVERLIELIDGSDASNNTIYVPHQLIVRRSTDLSSEATWDLYGW